jgi:ATP-dependent Clp protease adaptor protein ClpS
VPNSPLSSVLLLNDDVTPMEFVVNLLQDFFGMDYDAAIKLMLRVHHEGKAVCGTYDRDEAETRLAAILALAHKHNHPLKCIVAEAR